MSPEEVPQGHEKGRENDDSADATRSKRIAGTESEKIPSSRYSAAEMGKRARSLGSLGMIPILLAVGPIIGLFIGQWLDKKFNSAPWLTALFVILGFVAVIREMIHLLKRYGDEDKDSHPGDSSNHDEKK